MWITEEKIKESLSMKECINIVKKVFLDYVEGKAKMPPKNYLFFPKGYLRIMPAHLLEENVVGIKIVNVHPKNPPKLPSVMATILLFSTDNGKLLTIMDGTYITAMRTGAAGAIAAKYLARENSKIASFIGCGVQSYTQLDGLLNVRKIQEVKAYDINKKNLENFCEYANSLVKTNKVESVEDACRDADIIVTTTPSRKPIVKVEYVKNGCHINAIGADAPGKQELESVLLKKAKIVVDDIEQAKHSGEINVPLKRKTIMLNQVYAKLGEIVAGKKPGRKNEDEITLFDSTGLAIQDAAVAAFIYNKLKSN